ncbi:hypothetical protein [Dolosigranulum pigrum]|uniref:hypothetical protein n=1 Tax=Dolosigranulum pigrum TaxID=29394 RepID=UPI001AD8804D|nr:hypothetical protein [Dolosigranulum pigrum]QTJ42653.1 hypothetical protein FE327_01365 [Dolosigranulum pigrum]QTJ46047.1 hypothetical protein FE329_01370 [Dolosigranulum pigrum]QTJ56863.1 hypothetical protein FE335_04835 [Dolosigranulum pigrum]QTJ59563.1 hypothetical protein FE337_01370 [Dolosigranulum pigrum]
MDDIRTKVIIYVFLAFVLPVIGLRFGYLLIKDATLIQELPWIKEVAIISIVLQVIIIGSVIVAVFSWL